MYRLVHENITMIYNFVTENNLIPIVDRFPLSISITNEIYFLHM